LTASGTGFPLNTADFTNPLAVGNPLAAMAGIKSVIPKQKSSELKPPVQ